MKPIPIAQTGYCFDPNTLAVSLAPTTVPIVDVQNLIQTVLQVHVTDSCNMRCSYCFEHGAHTPSHMTCEVADAIVHYISRNAESEYSPFAVNFFGGEPLLNMPVIRRMVDSLKPLPVRFCVTTNGTLVTDDVVTFLIRHGIEVSLSIDGPAHIHDHVRRTAAGERTYEQVLSSLARLQDAGVKCQVEAVVQLDETDLLEQFEFLRSLGVDRFVMPFNYFYEPPLSLKSASRLKDHLCRIRRVYVEDLKKFQERCYSFSVGNCFGTSTIERIHNRRAKAHRCTGSRGFSVSPRGEVFPCSPLVADERYLLGRIWDMQGVPERKTSLTSACLKCWAAKLCGGPCQFQQTLYGEQRFPDPTLCEVFRTGFLETLIAYVEISLHSWEVLAYFERKKPPACCSTDS